MYDFQEQFYQVMTRLRANPTSRSRAASTSEPRDDARVTEVINGLLVSKPAKKVEEISENKKNNERQPEITILNDSWEREKSKAASVPGINKIKAITDFINSNGRI